MSYGSQPPQKEEGFENLRWKCPLSLSLLRLEEEFVQIGSPEVPSVGSFRPGQQMKERVRGLWRAQERPGVLGLGIQRRWEE